MLQLIDKSSSNITVNLITPDYEIREWISRNIDPNAAMPFVHRSYPGLGMSALTWPSGMRQPRRVEIGRFVWPSGMSRWAYGFFLMGGDQLEYFSSAPFGADGTKNNLITLKMASGKLQSDETLTTDLYMLPPTPIARMTKQADKQNNLYLITLVDERYFFQTKPLADLGMTTIGTITWTALFTAIKSQLGIPSFLVDTINSEYMVPSPLMNLIGEPIPYIADAAAFNVGQRIIRTYDGGYHSMSYSTAQTTADADDSRHPDRTIRSGGVRFDDI
jgi:hypothetical protein